MTTQILSPSGLKYNDQAGDSDWNANWIFNFERLNNVLLFLNVMGDVNTTGLADGKVLSYHTSSSEWKPRYAPPGGNVLTTTTTTTATTTTTT